MALAEILKKEDNVRLDTNPYSSRMPVTDPGQFHGRYEDLLRVAESIKSWQIFAVSGEPRIGKTSLLYYLIHPDGARAHPGFLKYIGNPADYLFVTIELQRLPVRNAQGFWRYLLDRLTEEARKEVAEKRTEQKADERSQETESDYYQVQTIFESYLKQLKRKVLFLFDDFDIVINDFDTTEVVQVTDKLRTLKEALDLTSKLNYVIVSTDPLVRLFKARGITNPSPLTSIIIPMTPLGLLEKDAADELMREPLRQYPENLQFTENDLDFIYKLAGRYPDFMKITCFYLFAALLRGNADHEEVRQNIEDDPHVCWLMNGLCERIKQEMRQEGLALGEVLLQVAQGQKPIDSPAYRELCRRGLIEDATSPPHIFGDLFRAFVLHKASSPASATTTSIKLTPFEERLYNYLDEHSGQTCSREQLQKAIWGNKVPSSPDALEQLVKRVREKIEPNRNLPIYLINVRGQGYLLRDDAPRLL